MKANTKASTRYPSRACSRKKIPKRHDGKRAARLRARRNKHSALRPFARGRALRLLHGNLQHLVDDSFLQPWNLVDIAVADGGVGGKVDILQLAVEAVACE